MANKALIVDDFLPEQRAKEMREASVALPYYNIRFHGGHYNRVHWRSNDELKPEIEAVFGRPIDQQFTFFRRNVKGEMSKDMVHHDADTSEYVALLYLNRPEDCQGGTALFRHKATGKEEFPSEFGIRRAGKSPKREQAKFTRDWMNAEAWEMTELLDMKFNRVIIYPCNWFHSRYPREAFGTTPEDSRTIWLSFFNVNF